MSSFEEIAFKALSGGGNIPFADEDVSTSPSTPGQLFSTDDLRCPDKNFGLNPVENRLSNFHGPLLKSCTESSVPSTRYLHGLTEARSALRKSRTDGCVPISGNRNPLERYETALLKYRKPEYGFKSDHNEIENGHGYSSSDDSVLRKNKSKSINSIDAQSVNNILDQYEELDCRRSSDLSDAGSIDVTNFEATMNLQKQREVSRLKKSAVLGPTPIDEINAKSSPIETQSKPEPKIAVISTKKIDDTEDQHHVNTEVEILLRKGEVQKRVDEWLSQTQNQNFKVSKDRGLIRSNSSSCYRYRSGDARSKLRAGNEAKETLNVALSCDELNSDKGCRDEDKTVKTERRQLIIDKVSVGVNTSRGPYKEYLASRNKAKQNEQGAQGATVQRLNTTSRIPQRGNPNSSFLGRKIEGKNIGEKNLNADQDRGIIQDKSRNVPLAIPTRRSSLKHLTMNGGAGGGEAVGSMKVWANAKGLGVSELVTTTEKPTLPNKDRESRRPLIAREDKTDGGSTRRIVSPTLRHSECSLKDQEKTIENDAAVEIRNESLQSRAEPSTTTDLNDHLPVTGTVSLKLKNFQGPLIDQESGKKGPPVPRKLQQLNNANGTSNYVKCMRLVNRVSSFKPNNAMYATLQGDEDSGDGFATSVGSESVTRSHYATPKQIEKIYERPRISRNEPSPGVIHADDLEAIFKPNVTSTVSAYGDKTVLNSRPKERNASSEMVFGSLDEDIYAQVGDARCNDLLETILEDQRKEGCTGEVKECGSPGVRDLLNLERRFGTVQKAGNGNSKTLETIYASPRSSGLKQLSEQAKNTFTTFRSPAIREEKLSRSSDSRINPIVAVESRINRADDKLDDNLDANSLYESRISSTKISGVVKHDDFVHRSTPLQVNGSFQPDADTVVKESKSDKEKTQPPAPVVNAILMKTLRFEQDIPALIPKSETILTEPTTFTKNSFNSRDVLSNDYGNVLLQDSLRIKEEKLYVTKEEVEHEKLMELLRKGDFEAAKSVKVACRSSPLDRGGSQDQSFTIGCLQSVGSRGLEEETSMCCVLQGAERVFPSAGVKHGPSTGSGVGRGLAAAAPDLPLESLWAAGLDEGMGFPQRCSYAHHTLANLPNHSNNPDELWRERKLSYNRTPTTSTGIGSSVTDDIWTSGNERRFFRTSTTSTGLGSSLNLHDNNRSLESRDGDFYSTDVEDSKEAYRRYYPSTPTTSGLGSSSDRQSLETRHSRGDIPDHLWATSVDDSSYSSSRFNATINSSLRNTVTRQPRPNHDWMRTERVSRFNKHRTISQSPQREQEIWTSKLNELNTSAYATQRIPVAHKCHHQARRSFSTSIVADLAIATPKGSQQSLGSREFMELERSYTLSTPGGGSPICCPPCSPPPAPTAYISSARASSRRLGVGGPSSPERDPLGRLLRFLKTFYRESGTRDPPHLPAWAAPLPLGTLCPAHFQPHLQLIHKSEQEHRLENIKLDQIFAPVRLSDGSVSEAPRRVAVEGGPGSGRTTLCLRLLHQWATQVDGGSPALAFIVPLRELRGSPLLTYLSRELLPRTSSLGDAVAQVWRTLHLMEDRVLFVLDGYDECVGGRASLGDAIDLLEGRLFPDARILVTCSPRNSPALSPLVQRRVNLAGLEWPHVERLCAAYFIHNDIAERVRDFLEVLNAQPQPIRQLGQHPLGWIMLCSLYQDSGNLPEETSALIQAAVKCIVKRSLDPPVSYNEEIPGHCRKRLEDFGRLSLAALREGRCCYTESELRSRGGGLEVTRLGFLTRGLTFGQRRKPDLFTPIHAAVAEFLAAYYLTSVAQYANILRRELEGLPTGIIGHLAGLLGPKTHLILNQLCPLEVPPRAVFSLLKSAGASDGNIAAVCRLVGAGPGFGPAPNEPRSAPLVHTVPLELEGWARILESSACTLEALEVVFQVERGSDPRYLDDFFEALASNESVKLVRITSLLGQEFPADEAQRLARHLKSVLGKKRLNDFELVITCLEESAHDRLECVVSALCRGLTLASPQLARLVLDMNLSGEQVSRVCEALRNCVQVQALHLPHLGCGREGLASVAELLKERPLLALNLAGSWGAKNEDPSSSGISMGSGSGSGSSGCASSTLGTLPLNRCYSSLPRGAPTVYGSLTRPATLPRLPLGLGPVPMPSDRENGSKRNSDSVLCHRLPLLHPLPTCDLPSHQGTGFHEIFSAIREPSCKLRSLNVSKCLLGSLDAGCLAETIRRARHLDALRAAGASRPADMMPLVLALTEAPCLQLLDLASPRLALDDHPSRLLCHALARNSTIKLLSLEGWTFRIEESDSLSVFSELLRCTSVRELSLCNARLHLAVHEGPLSRLGRRDDAGAELLRAAAPPACPAIVFLRLAGFQVTVNDRLALRGPLLLPFLAGFTALSELDLSLDKSTIGGSSGSLLFIDDKILTNFFSCLSSNFKNLQSLRINFWRVTLEDCDRTMRHISKYLKLCNLSFLKMNGLIVTDSVKKVQIEHSFLHTILTNLQYLTWLCLDGIELNETQSNLVGKCVRDRFPGSSLEISAKDINVKSVKALVAAVEDGGRAEVVYTGGAHCRLRIAKIQKNGKHKKK